jgi:hypothetical protein
MRFEKKVVDLGTRELGGVDAMSGVPLDDPLLSGLNHAVVITADLDRLCEFYTEGSVSK